MIRKTAYIVKTINGSALQFLESGTLTCQDAEADRFFTRETAQDKATLAGLKDSQFHVERIMY